MKVLYILNSTLETGGATKAIVGLATQLIKRRVKPCFVVPNRDGIYNTLKKMGTPVFVLNYRQSIYPPTGTFKDKILVIPRLLVHQTLNIIAICKLCYLLHDNKPDIIHSNTSVTELGYYVSKILKIPHVQHIREYSDKDFQMMYFPSWSFVHSHFHKVNNNVVCITNDIMNYHGMSACDNACVIYDGVFEKKEEMTCYPKENYFLYAGRIEYAKGLDILLDAYTNYVRQTKYPCQLIVAGQSVDIPYKKKIEDIIQTNNLAKHVTFVGNVNNIYDYMQHAKALIIPSRMEGFGLCMPEAMYNCCLCVGNYKGGTKEQLEKGKNYTGTDIALRYSTTEELMAILKEIEEQPYSHWNIMIDNAFKTVNHFYSYEANAQNILNVYETILNKNNIPN